LVEEEDKRGMEVFLSFWRIERRVVFYSWRERRCLRAERSYCYVE